MSNVLVPYTEFAAPALGVRLHEIVADNKELLAGRHMVGLIERYGSDPDMATMKVRKGQGESNPQHFAIIDEAGEVQGSASIIGGLSLGKSRLSLPPNVSRRLAGSYVAYPYASHNVQAWTGERQTDLLYLAYGALADHFRHPLPSVGLTVWSSQARPWTIEPMRAPSSVHEAISASGLHKVATGRFDDAESGSHIPPKSVLYAHILSSEDSSPHSKLKELKTGRKSLLSRADEAVDAAASDNPLGT